MGLENFDENYDLENKSIARSGDGRPSMIQKIARGRKSAVIDRNPFFKLLSGLV